MSNPNPISITQAWVSQIVIGLNFCPFAKAAIEKQQIEYVLADGHQLEEHLHQIYQQCLYLDQHTHLASSLIIYPKGYAQFDQYLDLLELSQALLADQDYEGIYQIASFHPHYLFSNTEETDVSNFTNRSPFPIIQLIRESDLQKALEHYPNPEDIPNNNMDTCHKLGHHYFRQLFSHHSISCH